MTAWQRNRQEVKSTERPPSTTACQSIRPVRGQGSLEPGGLSIDQHNLDIDADICGIIRWDWCTVRESLILAETNITTVVAARSRDAYSAATVGRLSWSIITTTGNHCERLGSSSAPLQLSGERNGTQVHSFTIRASCCASKLQIRPLTTLSVAKQY
jgi:hypothetical protein